MWNLTPEQRTQAWVLRDLLDNNRPYTKEEVRTFLPFDVHVSILSCKLIPQIPVEFETTLQSPEGIPFPIRVSISHFGNQCLPSEEPSFVLEMTVSSTLVESRCTT